MGLARLILTTGPDAGREYVLPARGAGIGRGHWNAIQLSDPTASRSHCVIDGQDGRYVLIDSGSRFGTAVNRLRVREPRPLDPGDQISVGETVLVYRPHHRANERAAPGNDGVETALRPIAAIDAPPGSQTIGARYELLGLIGVGGMGSVYKARDLELDELVALKVIRREIAQMPGMLDWVRREVRLSRRVTHKNVARAFDIGEHDGERFLTLELIDGESLSDLLTRQGPLAVAQMIDIVCDICAGLQAAHEVGVIHRDLKPDNVLIAVDGRVVITDFGLAVDPTMGEDMTGNTMLMGTPAYMAPEQVADQPVDARADVYALGITMFELLAGQVPFGGDSNVEIATARFFAPPPDIRAIRPDLPEAMCDVLTRCLAVEVADRMPSAAAVADELRRIARRAQIVARGSAHQTRTPGSSPPVRARDETHGEKLVAVLPLHNRGTEEDSYLSEGITDDLTSILAMTPGLRVAPRRLVAQAATGGRDPRHVGQELGVHIAVIGTVERRGSSIRVEARLLNVLDGFQLWAERFDGTAADLLMSNQRIARSIAQTLTLELHGPDGRGALDPRAVDAYLHGRAELRRFWPGAVERAIELFDRAIAFEPDQPALLAATALARARHWFFHGGSGVEDAAEIAERAVSLAPGHPEAHLAMASVRFQVSDFVAAVYELDRALSASPTQAEAQLLLGRILLESGPIDEAIRRLERAVELDPGLAIGYRDLARAHILIGRPDLADGWLDRAPPDPQTQLIHLTARARHAIWLRDDDAMVQLLARIDDDALPDSAPVQLVRWLGEMTLSPPEVFDHSVIEHYGQLGGMRRGLFFRQVEVEIAAAQGFVDHSVRALEQAAREGLVDIMWVDHCPLLATIRGEERFALARAEIKARSDAIVAAWKQTRDC